MSAKHPRPYCVLLSGLIGSATTIKEEVARNCWLAAVAHRRQMAAQLGRPVLLRIAALNLLSQEPLPAGIGKPILVSQRVLSSLEEALEKDSLTGVASRDLFCLTLEFALKQRLPKPIIIAYLDVDGLKRINDTRGHGRGDRLLVAIGEAWRTVSRRGDMMARLGGDEFAVMLPDCSLEEAHAVIERVSAECASGSPISSAALRRLRLVARARRRRVAFGPRGPRHVRPAQAAPREAGAASACPGRIGQPA